MVVVSMCEYVTNSCKLVWSLQVHLAISDKETLGFLESLEYSDLTRKPSKLTSLHRNFETRAWRKNWKMKRNKGSSEVENRYIDNFLLPFSVTTMFSDIVGDITFDKTVKMPQLLRNLCVFHSILLHKHGTAQPLWNRYKTWQR